MTTPLPAPTAPRFRIWVVGGGPMGLLAAARLARVCKFFQIPVAVRLFEADSLGGGAGDRSATPRCQLWCHTRGVIYATTQPEVALSLQRSTRYLHRLAPFAFRWPLALAIDGPRPASLPAADECFRALGIDHDPVSPEALRAWVPGVTLPQGSRAWRVGDGVMNLRLLSAGLAAEARAAGVEVVRERVTGVTVHGERVTGLKTAATVVPIGPVDVVVFACGANLRPLLRTAGISVPGLRVCVSHLVASDRVGMRSLIAVLRGGVNVVPHEQDDGRVLDVFGNSGRFELPPEEDGRPLRADAGAVERVVREVRESLGVGIPVEGRLAWQAVKTEMVGAGDRSQAHHAQLVPGLSNGWVAVPGKLSQAAECARDLALKIVRRRLDGPFAASIWEAVPKVPRVPVPAADEPETVFPLLVNAGA